MSEGLGFGIYEALIPGFGLRMNLGRPVKLGLPQTLNPPPFRASVELGEFLIDCLLLVSGVLSYILQ